MSAEDETPAKRQSTLELILESCNRTEAEAKETRAYAERSHDISLQMFQEHKKLRTELDAHKAEVGELQRRSWVPAALSIIAAIISIACTVAAAAR